MNKVRKFLLKQFKTASALRLLGFQIGAHRCVWWGMPTIVAFAVLFSAWYNQEWLFAKIPIAYQSEWWMKVPMVWYTLMFISGGIALVYFYFVFIHFRIFPMTKEEWEELVKDKLIEL